jgi:hypothetical protein
MDASVFPPGIGDGYAAQKAEMKQLLADMKPISPQKAEEDLAQVLAEERDSRKRSKQTTGQLGERN